VSVGSGDDGRAMGSILSGRNIDREIRREMHPTRIGRNMICFTSTEKSPKKIEFFADLFSLTE